MKKIIYLLQLLLLLVIPIPVQADAPAQQPIQITLRAEWLAGVSETGAEKWQALASDGGTQAGDVIRYTLTIVNGGALPISGIVVTQPIPTGTTYLPSTARQSVGYAAVAYLAGSDTQFTEHPLLTPSTNGAEPAAKPIPAPAATYRQARWTFTQPLPAKTTVFVSYEVVVR